MKQICSVYIVLAFNILQESSYSKLDFLSNPFFFCFPRLLECSLVWRLEFETDRMHISRAIWIALVLLAR